MSSFFVDCVPPFVPCFSEIISEVILVKSIFHWKDSQSIISGNNSQLHSMNVHCIILFLFVCSLVVCCCYVTFQFDDVIILSQECVSTNHCIKM